MWKEGEADSFPEEKQKKQYKAASEPGFDLCIRAGALSRALRHSSLKTNLRLTALHLGKSGSKVLPTLRVVCLPLPSLQDFGPTDTIAAFF